MNNLNSILDYLKVFNNINKRKAYEPRTMAQEPRNMAHGGRIGLDNGGLSFSRGGKKRNPLTSEMTPEQIRKQNAQKTFRKKGLGSASESNPKFVDFLETYKTRDQQTLERGEELKKANKLKNKARTIEAIKELPGDVVLKGSNRIKDGFLIRQNLLNSYHTFFEQAYDEAIEAGGLFNRADLGRAVIKKIEEAYPNHIDNMDFFPGGSKNVDSVAYYEYVDRQTSSSAKFRQNNNLVKTRGGGILKNFSTKAQGLRKTKQQEKIFKLLSEGVNEVDEIATTLGYSRAQVGRETEKLLNNMFVRSNAKPTFLKGKDKLYGEIINSLENSESLGNFYKRNMKSLVHATFPQDKFPRQNKAALNKIKEFDIFKKQIKAEFPGIDINYDHPASYQALKNNNFKNFLNVTPLADDVNILKSRFDLDSIRNLENLQESYRAQGPNSVEYKKALKKQRGLEKLWSDLTGGKSSLGKIRINRQQTGTTGLEDPTKNLKKEYLDNLSIRSEIKNNLTPDMEKRMDNMFPMQKGTTASITRAKEIAQSDLGAVEQKIIKKFKDAGIDCIKGAGGQCNSIADYQKGFNKAVKEAADGKGSAKAIQKLKGFTKLMRAGVGAAKWSGYGLLAEAGFMVPFAVGDYAAGKSWKRILGNATDYGFGPIFGQSEQEEFEAALPEGSSAVKGEKVLELGERLTGMGEQKVNPGYGRVGFEEKAPEQRQKVYTDILEDYNLNFQPFMKGPAGQFFDESIWTQAHQDAADARAQIAKENFEREQKRDLTLKGDYFGAAEGGIMGLKKK
jgi:predicted transcriptional regulator